MSMMRPVATALSAAVGLALLAPAAFAGTYPGQACVSAKLKSAAKECQADLTAWSKWDGTGDSVGRDAALGANAATLAAAWTKAEAKATAKGVDCIETTLTAAETSAAIDTAISDIVTTVNTGLTIPAECGVKLLKAAAQKCGAFLKAESGYVNKLAKDPTGIKRDAAKDKASTKFTTAFTSAMAIAGCPTTATAIDIETKIDELNESIVTDATTSPHLATVWTPVDPPTTVNYQGRALTPICSRDTPYQYFVKRGTGDGVHKLLVYYQGGGACWDTATCSVSTGAFDDDVLPGDNPANTTTGFGDLNNPNNPVRDWNAVFVSYCTGDIHWGDNKAVYSPGAGHFSINHYGFQNAKVVEKWAREHFVNPDEVFVAGSSAGAYGAVLHGVLLHDVYPASTFNIVGDAGNGVITQAFLTGSVEQSWHIQQNLPSFVPGLDADVTTLTIADLYGKSALFYEGRGSRFAQYTTAWDGGGGSQTFFYNVMVNGILDFGSWWHSSCDWNTKMHANNLNAFTQAPANYRYYIGPGSRHTIYGSNRVYTETHGGVPTFVDWLDNMRNNTNPWVNVECTDCSLLGACDGASPVPGASCQHNAECSPGVCTPIDTRPNPLQPPFELGDGFSNCP